MTVMEVSVDSETLQLMVVHYSGHENKQHSAYPHPQWERYEVIKE